MLEKKHGILEILCRWHTRVCNHTGQWRYR